MDINEETVHRIARLSRIELNESEIQKMRESLSGIFAWIAQLNEVNVENVAPLFNVTLDSMPVRKDIVTDGDYPEQILSNAPETLSDMFTVPKVVE